MASEPPKTALDHFNASAEGYEAGTGGCTREVGHHILTLIHATNPITASSTILDNACGTGVISDVLTRSPPFDAVAPRPAIHAVDGAPNMVTIARGRFAANPNVHAATMPGEGLEFPDNHFSHSVTNLGLMFFREAARGASEIRRTLAPGGVAVVTGWEDMGFVPVLRAVQAVVRPSDEPYSLPLPPQWLRPEHTAGVLRDAGFRGVELSTFRAHWAADDFESLGSALMGAFAPALFDKWSEEERGRARVELGRVLLGAAESFARVDGTEAVGLKMEAIVAVCRK